MDKAQAIHNFWSRFGLTAYDETIVPEDAQTPYLTYNVTTDSLDYVVMLNASLWYRDSSWATISQKAEEISEYLGNGGIVIPLDKGYLYIYRGTPFAQRLADATDELVRRIFMNINCEFLTDK